MKKLTRGFTLIELTVSMGVLALIVGLTAGILISVVKSYQKQRVISEIERNGDFVMRSLEESLRGAQGILCTDYTGTVITDANDGDPSDGDIQCTLGTNRLLYINYAISSRYYGRGMDGVPTCNASSNCLVYTFTDMSAFNGGTGYADSQKMTNSGSVNGVHIEDFVAEIRGDGTSGQPYNITVTMVVKGPIGSAWAEEARTFQSFLTLRGTYR